MHQLQLQATAACVMRITRAWRTLLIFPPVNGSIVFNVCLPAPEPGSFRACHFTENRSLIFKSVVRSDFKRIFLRFVARTPRAIEISHLNTQKYGLFCSLVCNSREKDLVKIPFRIKNKQNSFFINSLLLTSRQICLLIYPKKLPLSWSGFILGTDIEMLLPTGMRYLTIVAKNV